MREDVAWYYIISYRLYEIPLFKLKVKMEEQNVGKKRMERRNTWDYDIEYKNPNGKYCTDKKFYIIVGILIAVFLLLVLILIIVFALI